MIRRYAPDFVRCARAGCGHVWTPAADDAAPKCPRCGHRIVRPCDPALEARLAERQYAADEDDALPRPDEIRETAERVRAEWVDAGGVLRFGEAMQQEHVFHKPRSSRARCELEAAQRAALQNALAMVGARRPRRD